MMSKVAVKEIHAKKPQKNGDPSQTNTPVDQLIEQRNMTDKATTSQLLYCTGAGMQVQSEMAPDNPSVLHHQKQQLLFIGKYQVTMAPSTFQ